MPIVQINEEGGRYRYGFSEYIGDIIAENRQEQLRTQKIREGAFGRKIGSIPSSIYRSWQLEFERTGGKQQDKWVGDWRVFLWRKLQAHPEFRTVQKLKEDTVNAGHIFIR